MRQRSFQGSIILAKFTYQGRDRAPDSRNPTVNHSAGIGSESRGREKAHSTGRMEERETKGPFRKVHAELKEANELSERP